MNAEEADGGEGLPHIGLLNFVGKTWGLQDCYFVGMLQGV
jgi:hypothetical protein